MSHYTSSRPFSSSSASSASTAAPVLQSLPWSVDQTALALVRAGVSKDDARILQSQDVDGESIAFLSDESLTRMGIPTFGRRVRLIRIVQAILEQESERRGVRAPNLLATATRGAAAASSSGSYDDRDPYATSITSPTSQRHRGAAPADPFLGVRSGGFEATLGDKYSDDNLLDPAALTPAGGSNALTRTRDYGVVSSSASAAAPNVPRSLLSPAAASSSSSTFSRNALRTMDRADVDRDRDTEEAAADVADLVDERNYDSDIDRDFHHPRLDAQVAEYDPHRDPDDPFLAHDPAARAKPWLGSIVPPTRIPQISLEPPNRRLQLEWVHGYRAFDSRSNLMYNAAGDIVYPVAGLCVVYRPRTRTQKFFFGHNDDVRCLAQHPLDKNIIASGQNGGIKEGIHTPPHICVWDSSSSDLSRSYTLQCTAADRAIRSVAFNGGEGRYLASVSSDAHYSLKIWDWKKRLLLTAAKSDINPIFMVRGNPKDDSEFVTVGKQHVMFWKFDGHVLKNSRGIVGGAGSNISTSADGASPINFYSITFSEKGYACLGAENGSIYVFVGGKVAKTFSGVHRGKILTLEWYNGGFVSGGSDGRVHVLDKKMDVAKSFQFSNKVTSVAIGGPHGNDALLVGTQGSDVFEVREFFDQTIEGDEKLDAVTRGHSDGELYALAVAGDGKHFVTAGEDNSLCLWNLESHRLLKRGILSDRKGHVLNWKKKHGSTSTTHPVNQCARAIAISPSGSEILVGSNEGELIVFDTRTFARKKGVNLSQHKKDMRSAVDGMMGRRGEGNTSRSHWISTIQYSPSGHAVAVGTHGAVIILLDVTAGYAVRAVIDRSNAPITALDWSLDGSLLQSNDMSFTLLHYHVDEQDLKAVTPITNATSVRDVAWATHTCTLSWVTSGVTPPHHQGQFVNTADANPSRTLIATGDDSGHVNLFRFPALPGAQPLAYSGHSAHVTTTRFTPDDRYLLTTGGHDLSIFQWAVLNQ